MDFQPLTILDVDRSLGGEHFAKRIKCYWLYERRPVHEYLARIFPAVRPQQKMQNRIITTVS